MKVRRSTALKLAGAAVGVAGGLLGVAGGLLSALTVAFAGYPTEALPWQAGYIAGTLLAVAALSAAGGLGGLLSLMTPGLGASLMLLSGTGVMVAGMPLVWTEGWERNPDVSRLLDDFDPTFAWLRILLLAVLFLPRAH